MKMKHWLWGSVVTDAVIGMFSQGPELLATASTIVRLSEGSSPRSETSTWCTPSGVRPGRQTDLSDRQICHSHRSNILVASQPKSLVHLIYKVVILFLKEV